MELWEPTVSHSIDVGDQPNHSYAISQMNCTGEKGEVGGVKEKEGIGSAFDENTGNATHWHVHRYDDEWGQA
jgi:hypothetical protein